MNLFNSDKVFATTSSVSALNGVAEMASGDLVTVPVTAGADLSLLDKTKNFIGDNKELLAVAAVGAGVCGYMYYQNRKAKEVAASVAKALSPEQLAEDLTNAINEGLKAAEKA